MYVYRTSGHEPVGFVTVGYMVLYGAGMTAIELSCFWLALGNRWLWLRIALVAVGVPALAYAASAKGAMYYNHYSAAATLPWFMVTLTVATLLTVSSLWILRAHGNRLRYSET